jgi:uracil-DNA glycosylase
MLLDNMLRDAGLGRSDDWFVCNAVACRPPYNASPTPDQVRWCSTNLRDQIKLCNPQWVVPLGNVGLNALGCVKTKITAAHGRPFEIPVGPAIGRKCLPVFHPSAALREGGKSGKKYTEIVVVFDYLRQLLDGEVGWETKGMRVGASGKLYPL